MLLSFILGNSAFFIIGIWVGKTTNEGSRIRSERRRWEREQAKLPRAIRRTEPICQRAKKKTTKEQRLRLDDYERSTA